MPFRGTQREATACPVVTLTKSLPYSNPNQQPALAIPCSNQTALAVPRSNQPALAVPCSHPNQQPALAVPCSNQPAPNVPCSIHNQQAASFFIMTCQCAYSSNQVPAHSVMPHRTTRSVFFQSGKLARPQIMSGHFVYSNIYQSQHGRFPPGPLPSAKLRRERPRSLHQSNTKTQIRPCSLDQ